MVNKSTFQNLFILDMANNHQGSVEHGMEIISSMGSVCKEKGVRGAIKFQYRQLDTFIHPDYKEATDPKHIKRFLETRLQPEQFKKLVDEVKRDDLVTICTPFDEESVDVIEDHGIEVIKIASCSVKDWPLLERVALTRKPVVCSTGGASIQEIDKIVSFFSHKGIPLAIMHCVAIYPTDTEDLQLNQIDVLKARYPFLPVGFSTHEAPDNLMPVQLAIAKGAMLLERHVGVETDAIKLNGYSSTPEQIGKWFDSALAGWRACGAKERLMPKTVETDSLESLTRGIYAKKDISKGDIIGRGSVFFAMPYQENQLPSGEFTAGIEAARDYKVNEPIAMDEKNAEDIKKTIYSVIHQAKGLLYQARIAIGKEFSVELSHHYGVENFEKVGAIIIDCVNRAYCKKLIIQIPGQYHPMHYHKKKEETFQVLWGELLLNLDGENLVLRPGDQALVKPGQKHNFTTKTGSIVEEVSTTHYKNDSFYEDGKICVDVRLRKTPLAHAQHTFEQYKFL